MSAQRRWPLSSVGKGPGVRRFYIKSCPPAMATLWSAKVAIIDLPPRRNQIEETAPRKSEEGYEA